MAATYLGKQENSDNNSWYSTLKDYDHPKIFQDNQRTNENCMELTMPSNLTPACSNQISFTITNENIGERKEIKVSIEFSLNMENKAMVFLFFKRFLRFHLRQTNMYFTNWKPSNENPIEKAVHII